MYFQKIILILIFLIPIHLFAQKGGRDIQDLDFDVETTYGINWNTNGAIIGGVSARYAKRREANMFTTLVLEVVNVKHPRELINYTNSGFGYTVSKQNYLISVRPAIANEKVLFRKIHDEGIQMSWLLGGGPSFGFLLPYYVQYGEDQNSAQYVKYDPSVVTNSAQIYDKGGIFYGVFEPKINLGFHARTSMLFEYGTYKKNLTGVEIGMLAEVFTQKPIILSGYTNRSSFFSTYLTVYFGSRR